MLVETQHVQFALDIRHIPIIVPPQYVATASALAVVSAGPTSGVSAGRLRALQSVATCGPADAAQTLVLGVGVGNSDVLYYARGGVVGNVAFISAIVTLFGVWRCFVIWSVAGGSVSLGALRLPCFASIGAGIVLTPTSTASAILLYRGVGAVDVALGAFGMIAVWAYAAFVLWITTTGCKSTLEAVTARRRSKRLWRRVLALLTVPTCRGGRLNDGCPALEVLGTRERETEMNCFLVCEHFPALPYLTLLMLTDPVWHTCCCC